MSSIATLQLYPVPSQPTVQTDRVAYSQFGNPIVYPSSPKEGDELFLTDNGTNNSTIRESYIFDNSVWLKRPISNVRFGTTVPSALSSDIENDTYIQTSNGLNTGTVIASFVFDKTSNTWIKQTADSQDFWRSGSIAGLLPDGTTDPQDAIFHNGQVVIDTNVAGDSGLTLDDLRSRASVQATAGDSGVTDTNMTAIGVDTNGKLKLSNALSSPDLRGTNPNPQDYSAGVSYAFKQSAIVGLTGVGFAAIPPYVELETTRRYASGGDFSGGQVIQRVFLEDGRSYFRVGTSATTWGTWNLEGGSRANLQTRWSSQATSKVSIAGEFRWSGFYHVMTMGTNTTEPGGHFRIDMPADGFAVPVAGGGTRAVVPSVVGSSIDTGGILLNAWDTLWYRHVTGSGQASVPANFLIVPYTANTNTSGPFTNPDEWIKIVSRDDASTYQLGNGDTMGLGGQVGRGADVTASAWTAMKQRAMGSGYYFSPGGNTAIPTAFGFTGAIRWINSGSVPYVNGAGYLDTPATRAVGLTVRGVNGATNKTWRLMTAAEKPEWFGGALRGNDAIIPASTTVVDLLDNETLFYVPNIESGTAQGQWVVAGYSGFVNIPPHWMPIASRQTTGANSTIQVLIGGVQQALRAGDANYMSIGGEGITDRLHRKVTHKGIKHCRWTTDNFFAGTAANGALGSVIGLMVNWADNSMIWGISDGYNSWGNQFSYINVPAVGYNIPVVSTNSNITRTVQDVGGLRFVPLGVWEALYFIPPAYAGGSGSVNGDFVIGYYSSNHSIPRGAVLIAKYEGTLASAIGTGTAKNRILFADGTYIQAGASSLAAGQIPTLYDEAHGSAEWRNITVAGGTVAQRTSPGNNAPLPAVTGVTGNYTAPYTAQYRNLTLDDDPRGAFEVKGLIELNANVTASSPNIAFIPGVQVYGNPIKTVYAIASTLGDNKLIPVQVRLSNATLGNQNGVYITSYVSSLNTAVNPYFTLGLNGGTSPAGGLNWLSLDNIGVVPCL